MPRFGNNFWLGYEAQVDRLVSELGCPPLKASATKKRALALLLFIFFSFILMVFCSFYVNSSVAELPKTHPPRKTRIHQHHLNCTTTNKTQASPRNLSLIHQEYQTPSSPRKTRIHYHLNCTTPNKTQTCPRNVPLIHQDYQTPSLSCPDYFGWIHEDLRPWKEMGITREMVERARRTANFRLVILNGKAYVETYLKSFQTRDTFTLWGILQLLKMYPGKLPDLDLMFDCTDRPVILSRYYRQKGPNATAPPPLFRYCGSKWSLDIAFPDWSFWGWPEINIKPWSSLLKELKQGNTKVSWMDREPYAYWKGNPSVAQTRIDLMKCNVSDEQDWNARIYAQDWFAEIREGYKQSNLADQCIHRYKIYIEGTAWSVSQKYILACDSLTLVVKPQYYDMFTRSLVPGHHYWPIKENDKCKSIKFAVDWGNTHKKEAQRIGKAASDFIDKNLTMEYVYDYMFHLLSEYAKLLRYKPTKPEKAVEFCSEAMACHADGLQRKFIMESMVKSPSDTMPCNMPPPMN